MSFDACMMRAVIEEFSREFPEAKIERVLQPQGDEINLVIHSGGRSGRLVFNVGPNAPRLQLSDVQKENPKQAPMFCMLLRKLLIGGKITSVTQLGFDRIAVFKVSCYDDMGFKVDRSVVCEIMGKYANLIVLDSDNKILAALKIIDFAASTVRQVIPGMKYQIPAQREKMSPLVIDKDKFFDSFYAYPSGRSSEKFITDSYSGIATQIAHELVYRATGSVDTAVSETDPVSLYSVFSEWQQLLIDHRYTPTSAVNSEGKPIDYSYMPITYLGNSVRTEMYPDFKCLFDKYFAERDRLDHIRERSKDIMQLLDNTVARTERKLGIQRQALLDSDKGELYKREADLITANLYKLSRGMESFTAIDYYDENCPEIEVKLDPRLHPSQNAQKKYKLYQKCKNAKIILAEQIELWERELKYLESVQVFLENAEREDDLAEIRDELYRAGYASRMRGYTPPRKLKSTYTRLRTTDGKVLLVGKNNVQNDNLSHRLADRDDLWFHTKDIPGSHVILVTDGEEPTDLDYTEAARVAARYSKAKGDNIAVDYTRVKNLRKPAGSKPGFVTYKTNYTAFVRRASDDEIETMLNAGKTEV